MYSILLVDDEKTIREYLPKAIAFEDYGFTVRATAVNGEEALVKVAAFKPDLILLDVKMPVMGGLQFLKTLRQGEYSNTLVVMLSGFSDFEYAKEAIKYGVKDYLTKPVDEEEIIPLLKAMAKELEEGSRRKSRDLFQERINYLNDLYNGAATERELLGDCTLMTCVLLPGSSEQNNSNTHTILGECIKAGQAGLDTCLFRTKSSQYTFLLSPQMLKQEDKKAFAAGLLEVFKKHGLNCTLMFDSQIFNSWEKTFREDFAEHTYSMLTELFFSPLDFMDYSPDLFRTGTELCLEGKYLEELKHNLISLERQSAARVIDRLVNEVEEIHLGIHYVQEITYRIYYLILDEINSSENQNHGEAILPRPEWLDLPHFISFSKWKDLLRSMVANGMVFIERRYKLANMGIGREVIQYIHLHYMEQISIKKVSDKFFVNAAYLGRVFQKATGVNFNQYVNQLRIAESKRLLLQTDKLIYEIANEVGYSESCYFITKFTQEVGLSPNEFRNQINSL